MTQASIERHHEALHEKHVALDKAIHDEEGRPMPDRDNLRFLKTKKLSIREQMESATVCS